MFDADRVKRMMVVVPSIEADRLKALLDDPPHDGTILLIDSRPFLSFNAGHIRSAHNVHCPPILLRRRRCAGQDGGTTTIPLADILRCADSRERLVSGLYETVIVYDQRTLLGDGLAVELDVMEEETSQELSRSHPLQLNSNLNVVLKSLCQVLPLQQIEKIYYLNGGYDCFSINHKHIISSVIHIDNATSADKHVSMSNQLIVPVGDDRQWMLNSNERYADTINRWDQKSTKIFDTVKWHLSKDKGDPIEILPWLYLGNSYHALQEDRLKALGILALLNVAETTGVSASSSLRSNVFCHMNLPIADNATSDIQCKFPQAIEFIENVRLSGGKVLVHCLAGISRSPAICMAYLMYSQNLTLDEAHDLLKVRRRYISPNLNFLHQLAEYEQLLKINQQQGCTSPRSQRRSHMCMKLSPSVTADGPFYDHTSTSDIKSTISSSQIDCSTARWMPTIDEWSRKTSRKRPRPSSLSTALPVLTPLNSLVTMPCKKQANFTFDFSSVTGLPLSSNISRSPLLPAI